MAKISRIPVLGSFYSRLQRQGVEDFLLQHALNGGNGYVCVANVHTTMMGFFEPSYQQITNESLLSIPDGMPLVWAMRSLGAKEQDRVRGPSLMRDLVVRGKAQGARHYLYGGSSSTIEALQKKLQTLAPGIEIVGAESPPYRPVEEITAQEWDVIAERINKTKPHFVWVGLGAPKQEIWMWQQRARIKGVMLGVGAAFDLLSDKIPEAPQMMQRMGLEWLYRLWREPGRLWQRYVLNNPLFLLLWAKDWFFYVLVGRRES